MADDGVRRSNSRRCESDETADISAGLDGQNEVLYVQLPIGSVLMEKFRVGDHCSGGGKNCQRDQGRKGGSGKAAGWLQF